LSVFTHYLAMGNVNELLKRLKVACRTPSTTEPEPGCEPLFWGFFAIFGGMAESGKPLELPYPPRHYKLVPLPTGTPVHILVE